MDASPDVASVASLVGEPARARMLTALMEGRALTASELSMEGRVAPSTASSHLQRLARGGLVTMARQSASERKWLRCWRHGVVITPEGEKWFQGLGIGIEALRGKRRPVGRSCLD